MAFSNEPTLFLSARVCTFQMKAFSHHPYVLQSCRPYSGIRERQQQSTPP